MKLWKASTARISQNMALISLHQSVPPLLAALFSSVALVSVTSVFGAVTSLFLIIVIGLFVAVEPRLYERGVGWMLPMRSRDGFYRTIDRMAYPLRRLMAGDRQSTRLNSSH